MEMILLLSHCSLRLHVRQNKPEPCTSSYSPLLHFLSNCFISKKKNVDFLFITFVEEKAFVLVEVTVIEKMSQCKGLCCLETFIH